MVLIATVLWSWLFIYLWLGYIVVFLFACLFMTRLYCFMLFGPGWSQASGFKHCSCFRFLSRWEPQVHDTAPHTKLFISLKINIDSCVCVYLSVCVHACLSHFPIFSFIIFKTFNYFLQGRPFSAREVLGLCFHMRTHSFRAVLPSWWDSFPKAVSLCAISREAGVWDSFCHLVR